MAKVFDAQIILQNSIHDWQQRIRNSNPKETFEMIKKKIAQIERMNNNKDIRLRW